MLFLGAFGLSGVESALKLVGLIILCAIIIAASYFTTRFVGKKQQNMSGGSNFRSIDVYRLGQNKYLQIIQAGKRYFLIAVSKDSVETIAELSEDDIVNFPSDKKVSFKKIMAKVVPKKKKSEEETDTENKNSE